MSNAKFALITGATSGIGYELAKLFARDKYNLIIVSRNKDELDRKAAEFRSEGIEVVTIAKDLFQKDQVQAVIDEVQSKGIMVDVLVNNAGQGAYGLFQDNELERELAIIDLNIAATVILTKHFVTEMVGRNSGKILNVASIAGTTPGPWQAVYHATKAFVLSFTEGLRSELSTTEITVTALLPGVTDTDFFNKAGMLSSKVAQDKDAMADPADVAKDGYEALMSGSDKVVSGLKNKVQVALGNVTPATIQAEQLKKMQEPAEKDQK
ncbi:SDR family NAD(P)-dependent oxidoreductase [Flavobacterium selenitireducens]|uniref:SDR family NAD(P)-dependent oxidoreductase n=1 Tax=Flavobacterium selenitireducens TaxID=2722704 RepID=UPI00168AC96C|nr:SDR family oxidoreductase [Flavobacterium selenitireducens]MBD3581287.1 SDR family oxidoreductase [Flavobacterium selenitireducens]